MSTEFMISRPDASEHAEYYSLYINRVPDGDIREHLLNQIEEFRTVLDGIEEDDACVLHEPYTWTIKQVVGHLIDVERVFGYRALRFGSGDVRPIPGMEQNDWVDNTDYESPSLKFLTDELVHSRHANICFFVRLKPDAWDSRAEADGNEMTVRALAYCLVGHITHHLEIIKKRLA
ncbi:MAG: DinB family protein [Planctomycetota bacterium]